jgi:acyl-CoA thioester hydrolase
MTQSQGAFEIRARVEPTDIDQNGHVNNIVYLRWAQDAAAAHWNAVAPATDQQSLSWIILRHEIDYKQAAYLGDEIAIQTWVGTASRFRFERHTEIIRVRDEVLLATARTIWCALDAKTRKPAVVSPEVRACFSV